MRYLNEQSETYLSTNELVVPAEDTVIRTTPEGTGMLGEAWHRHQLKVRRIACRIIQPRATPHKLIPVARRIVEDGGVRATGTVPPPLLSTELEERFCTVHQLLGIGLAVLEHNGSRGQSSSHFCCEVRATVAFIDRTWVVDVLGSHPAVVIVRARSLRSVSYPNLQGNFR